MLTLFPGSHANIQQIEQAANKGRSDDCGSLRVDGLKYILTVPNIPMVDINAKKEYRGFNHVSTGRLLCPRALRDEFDKDPNAFCHSVTNGTRLITHDDWPSYLYPEKEYDPDAIDENLLRGHFLVAVRVKKSFLSFAKLYL